MESRHIQPDKLTQDAHVESFHGRLREGFPHHWLIRDNRML